MVIFLVVFLVVFAVLKREEVGGGGRWVNKCISLVLTFRLIYFLFYFFLNRSVFKKKLIPSLQSSVIYQKKKTGFPNGLGARLSINPSASADSRLPYL